MYRALSEAQLLGLYPKKQKQIQSLLSFLERQRRIFKQQGGLYTAVQQPEEYDRGLSRAVWVLVDFIDQVDFHSTGDLSSPGPVIFRQKSYSSPTMRYMKSCMRLWDRSLSSAMCCLLKQMTRPITSSWWTNQSRSPQSKRPTSVGSAPSHRRGRSNTIRKRKERAFEPSHYFTAYHLNSR